MPCSPAECAEAMQLVLVRFHPRRHVIRGQHDVPSDGAAMCSGCALDGQLLEQRILYHLCTGARRCASLSHDSGRVLLIGGPPFPETILMWWNFVARTPDEITQARADWEERRRFGEVNAYAGPRLAAPTLTRFARPNPVS